MRRIFSAVLTALLWLPSPTARSEEIHLICTGKFELNRGRLIKPDWETTYLSINLDGLISSIDDGILIKKGRTRIRRGSYYITHRAKDRRVKAKYSVNKLGNYSVEYLQDNKVLIGTCEKGRG